MQMTYVATIRNTRTKETKAITVENDSPMQAHKQVMWEYTTNDEDILNIRDNEGKLVFDLNKGFK